MLKILIQTHLKYPKIPDSVLKFSTFFKKLFSDVFGEERGVSILTRLIVSMLL